MNSLPPGHGFIVAGGDGSWIVHLAEALSGYAPTLLLSNPQIRGWVKPRLQALRRPANRARPADPARWTERTICVPSVFRRPALQRFNSLVELPVRWSTRNWARRHGVEPWLVLPYPWLRPVYRGVPDARTIYFNFDDYRLYDRRHAARLERQELALVAECRLTLCSSRTQVERFKAAVPAAADRILHFPHGTLERVLHTGENAAGSGTVGYVGNLGDRLDWRLVLDVVQAMPRAVFEFVGSEIGRPEGGVVEQWRLVREQVRQQPNVRFTPWVPHERIHEKYREFAVSWMPYAVDHAFNLAASPTKLMDTFAAGRPLVSTSVPESLLYPELVAVADRPAALVAELTALLDPAGPARAARVRLIREFAANNTWRHRAGFLIGQLAAQPAPAHA